MEEAITRANGDEILRPNNVSPRPMSQSWFVIDCSQHKIEILYLNRVLFT